MPEVVLRAVSLVLLLLVAAPAQTVHTLPGPWSQGGVEAGAIRQLVGELCSDATAGRRGATPGARLAAHLVAREFCRAGLRPAGIGGSYFQEFLLAKGKDKGRIPNVLGRLAGHGSLASQVVIFCAHYDHLGWGGGESRWQGERAIHHGANDNAAGVAALIGLARTLAARRDRLGRTILFAAWAAEELGSVGARWWLAHPTLPGAKVVAVVNLDMVGRLQKSLLVAGAGAARGLTPDLGALAGSLPVKAIARSFGGSDHQVFLNQGLPAVHLFTGADTAYHTPADTPERINAEGVVRVVGFAARLAVHLSLRSTPYPFDRKNAGGPPPRPPAGPRPAFGSVPDFGQARGGYKVARVKAGSPAAKAGLRAGDLIIRFAGEPLDGFMDFVRVLFRHQPGAKVSVVLLRGGKIHRVQVTLGRAAPRGHGSRHGAGHGKKG